MWRSLSSYLASLLLCLACFLPVSRAQSGTEGPGPGGPTPTASSSSSEGQAEKPSAFPWLVAVVFTVVILLVVCMPSRKN